MKRLIIICLPLILWACQDNKMMETPQWVSQEVKRKEDSTAKAWERQVLKQLSAASIGHPISVNEFITNIRNHSAVKGAQLTRTGFLYISVANNGTDKTQVATYLCRMAKKFSIREIKGVKIVDASDANFGKNGDATGTELGISVCNFINP
jgi:phosphoenolpyruvate-protein kinase (PTS system EI component)